jgi:hypothetical protein
MKKWIVVGLAFLSLAACAPYPYYYRDGAYDGYYRDGYYGRNYDRGYDDRDRYYDRDGYYRDNGR